MRVRDNRLADMQEMQEILRLAAEPYSATDNAKSLIGRAARALSAARVTTSVGAFER